MKEGRRECQRLCAPAFVGVTIDFLNQNENGAFHPTNNNECLIYFGSSLKKRNVLLDPQAAGREGDAAFCLDEQSPAK